MLSICRLGRASCKPEAHICSLLASPADILRGASRVLVQRGEGTRDASLRMSAGMASSLLEVRVQWPMLKNHIIIFNA